MAVGIGGEQFAKDVRVDFRIGERGAAGAHHALQVFAHLSEDRGKPAFGIKSVKVDGASHAVTESVVLASIGGVLAWLLTLWVMRFVTLRFTELDGFDLSPVLLGKGDSARGDFIYFRDTIPFAYRKGEYKIHVTTQDGYGDKPVAHDPPLLFHLGHDPSEQLDLAKGHPDLARSLRAELDRHTARIKPGPNQLE